MSKRAVSVTLSPENVAWLKGLAKARHLRSMSEALDRLVSEAREPKPRPPRTVVGTVTIDPSDPDLLTADATIRQMFEGATRRRRGKGGRRG